jgi:hypothetical protein
MDSVLLDFVDREIRYGLCHLVNRGIVSPESNLTTAMTGANSVLHTVQAPLLPPELRRLQLAAPPPATMPSRPAAAQQATCVGRTAAAATPREDCGPDEQPAAAALPCDVTLGGHGNGHGSQRGSATGDASTGGGGLHSAAEGAVRPYPAQRSADEAGSASGDGPTPRASSRPPSPRRAGSSASLQASTDASEAPFAGSTAQVSAVLGAVADAQEGAPELNTNAAAAGAGADGAVASETQAHAMATAREYEQLMDDHSAHLVIIRQGVTLDSTPEFESFQRTHLDHWPTLALLLLQLEGICTQYVVPLATVDGKALAALAAHLVPGQMPQMDALLACVTNIQEVAEVLQMPGRRFRGPNGQAAAATCIQAHMRGHLGRKVSARGTRPLQSAVNC